MWYVYTRHKCKKINIHINKQGLVVHHEGIPQKQVVSGQIEVSVTLYMSTLLLMHQEDSAYRATALTTQRSVMLTVTAA